jgi:hypothetical protein
MNTETTNISKNKEGMISVPKQTLQALIDNCELAVAGMGVGEEYVGRQCRELQRYLDAGQPSVTEQEISFSEFDNVEFVNFRKKS